MRISRPHCMRISRPHSLSFKGGRGLPAVCLACVLLLSVPALVSAHAEVSPNVSLTGRSQLYSLAVPTEKSGLTTAKIVMTVPAGFGIDSFAPPPPGWRMSLQTSGSGMRSVITQVIWAGGHTPTGQDSLFQFLAQPSAARSYVFDVRQTYSDGSIVDWGGAESSDAPAPRIEVVGSLGGGTQTLTIVALIVGVLGLLAGLFALASVTGSGEDKRPLV